MQFVILLEMELLQFNDMENSFFDHTVFNYIKIVFIGNIWYSSLFLVE